MISSIEIPSVASRSYDIRGDELRPLTLGKTSGELWAEKCLSQYPEMGYLADAAVRATEEGRATAVGSYSERLFGKKFIEFDRTLMTLHCMQLILEGDDGDS